ncbi:kinase-like domain-containing protein [Phaeosphaeriaceae sp. PMI808]|nr:kinase-like domain-containing protein [Phaeosphaeriaceae sp. PMI808]
MLRHGLPVLKFPTLDYRISLEEQRSTAKVCLSNDGKTVLKFALAFDLSGCDNEVSRIARCEEVDSSMLLEREKEVYRHLGEHEEILRCLDISAIGLQFPFMKNGNLRHYLSNPAKPIQLSTKLLCVKNATRSICFIHSMGVLQADISARNFLVDDDLSLVLCDFSGSAIGDQDALVGQETRYQKVAGVKPFCISIATEIFAVGSLIYEIMTDKRPYDEIEDEDEVEELFGKGNFPSTTYIPLGNVIRKCWLDGFSTAAEVLEDILMAEKALEMGGWQREHE